MQKLDSSKWNWNEVGKSGPKLKSTTEKSKFGETVQFEKKFSNFARYFPTSLGTFQLLVNFICPFQLRVSKFHFTNKQKDKKPNNQMSFEQMYVVYINNNEVY